MRILHLLPQIDAGGPARCLLDYLAHADALGLRDEHRVAALERRANPAMLARFARRRLVPVLAPAAETLAEQIGWADATLFFYWNAPASLALLGSPLPRMRLVLWTMTGGLHAPHLLLPEHAAFADRLVLTGPSPTCPAAPVVPGLASFGRLDGMLRDDDGATVAYLGNVTRAKLHPDFFALGDAVPGEHLRFPVAGGALDPWFAARHAATRRPERFEFPGFVEDIGALLGRAAVFGYPLAPDSYASCDQTLQQAMWAGLPPVVLAGTGAAPWVCDGATGRVAATAHDYSSLVGDLLDSPAERRRLGAAAADLARTAFAPAANAARLRGLLAEATRHPARERAPLFPVPAELSKVAAAFRFASALGPEGRPLVDALARPTAAAIAAAVRTLGALSHMATGGEGGLFQFRNAHREDSAFRAWTGVVLLLRGDAERAEGEFRAAREAGATDETCRAYRDAARAHAEDCSHGGAPTHHD